MFKYVSVVLAATMMCFSAEASELHTCFVASIDATSTNISIQCGGEPKKVGQVGNQDLVRYFALPVTDAAFGNRVTALAMMAIQLNARLLISFDADKTHNQAYCDGSICRMIIAVSLEP